MKKSLNSIEISFEYHNCPINNIFDYDVLYTEMEDDIIYETCKCKECEEIFEIEILNNF